MPLVATLGTIRIRYDPQDPRRAVQRPPITAIGAIAGFLPSAAILGFVAYVALTSAERNSRRVALA